MEAAEAHLSLHLSKCHIVENHMAWLKIYFKMAALQPYWLGKPRDAMANAHFSFNTLEP